MTESNHRIDGKRLWSTLMEMAQFGATEKGGVRRLALSEVDRAARAHFTALCQAAGLKTRVDAMGNMFARRPGRDASRPPVLIGSHLDSQPTGGKFDGALGVVAGLEVMRALNDHGIVTDAPVEVVNWTDEEGSRFGHGMVGSGVWAGAFSLETAYGWADAAGVTMGAELSRGMAGPEPAAAFPADAYFELHIEQGPILEREGKQIGIVTGGQGQIWFDGIVYGTESHAGTTPPSMRRDALVAAARIIDLVDRMMRARGEDGRGTIGQLNVIPNSRNTVPGEVRFSVEFRHPDTAEIDRIGAEFPSEAGILARDADVRLDLRELYRIAAQPFDPGCIDIVRRTAARLGFSARDIVSGAGHDAIFVARHVPTAMIFTPCKGGLSHNEAESVEPAEAAAGCQVLFEAVVERANRAV